MSLPEPQLKLRGSSPRDSAIEPVTVNCVGLFSGAPKGRSFPLDPLADFLSEDLGDGCFRPQQSDECFPFPADPGGLAIPEVGLEIFDSAHAVAEHGSYQPPGVTEIRVGRIACQSKVAGELEAFRLFLSTDGGMPTETVPEPGGDFQERVENTARS